MDVDAINGHLTATFADPYEVRNWAGALDREPDNFPYINSTKSMIGHCLGAAGAVECVAVVLQLHKGFLHPSGTARMFIRRSESFLKSIPHQAWNGADLKYPRDRRLRSLAMRCVGIIAHGVRRL